MDPRGGLPHTRAMIEQALAASGWSDGAAPAIDLRRYASNEPIAFLCSAETCVKLGALPLFELAGAVVVATAAAGDVELLQRLRFALGGRRVHPVLASAQDLRHVLAAAQGQGAPQSALEPSPEAGPEEPFPEESDSALVRLLNRIIVRGYDEGASDIHIEPRADAYAVRVRRDGQLSDLLTVPLHYGRPLVSRIKVMAALDISERRKAQDGKIAFRRAGQPDLELRVATIPVVEGHEAVVLRILTSIRAIGMEDLALSARAARPAPSGAGAARPAGRLRANGIG